jgi:hypothetical protein
LAFFVSRILLFGNFQNNMGRKKRAHLQEFAIIHLPKSKLGPTSCFFAAGTRFRAKPFAGSRQNAAATSFLSLAPFLHGVWIVAAGFLLLPPAITVPGALHIGASSAWHQDRPPARRSRPPVRGSRPPGPPRQPPRARSRHISQICATLVNNLRVVGINCLILSNCHSQAG